MAMSLQICPICKLPSFRRYRLCRNCADQIRPQTPPVVRNESGYVVRSLLSWHPEGPIGLTDLVYSMKGMNAPDAWLEFALWMANLFPSPRKDTLIVPVPGVRMNHALGLALAIGGAFKLPVEDTLVKVQVRSQKGLGRSDRHDVRFRLRGLNPCRDYRAVLVVDDVVTTGATAQAAYEALEAPKTCEVWCLMDRWSCDRGGVRV